MEELGQETRFMLRMSVPEVAVGCVYAKREEVCTYRCILVLISRNERQTTTNPVPGFKGFISGHLQLAPGSTGSDKGYICIWDCGFERDIGDPLYPLRSSRCSSRVPCPHTPPKTNTINTVKDRLFGIRRLGRSDRDDQWQQVLWCRMRLLVQRMLE